MTELLTGVCRTVFPWVDNSAILNIAFGTHSKLQVWQGGTLYDETPFGPPNRLVANPLTVTNGSAVVTVADVAHGYTTGQSLKVFGAAAVGGITPNGTFTITVTGVDAYTYTFTSNATSGAVGGGSNVVVTPQTALPAGAIDGTGSAGYGTGAYGAGPWGQTSATVDFFPRTWSFGAWGQNLIASPRGGGIYSWPNVTGTKAVALDNAPTQVTQILVAPVGGGYMLFALGCEEETSGVFNPACIRHSKIRDNTVWSTLASGSTAREYVLTGGGNIVAGRMCGPYMLIWTTDALFLGSYVGALNQPWRFDRVGRNCGLIGPNAAVVVGQAAYWASPDRQFYRYAVGGQPEPIPCPVLSEYAENLAASQGDKVVASSNAEFSEIRFDYPDAREGYENSRFVRLCVSGPDAGAWSGGIQARTAFVDAGPSLYPVGVTYEGAVYYHERGESADGSAFSWFIETADQLMDEEWRLLIKQVWPDFKGQLGPVTVTVTARETPQGDETVYTALPMAPGDAKADLMISGKFFRVRFSGDSSPTACRIGSPIFESQPAGKF